MGGLADGEFKGLAAEAQYLEESVLLKVATPIMAALVASPTTAHMSPAQRATTALKEAAALIHAVDHAKSESLAYPE